MSVHLLQKLLSNPCNIQLCMCFQLVVPGSVFIHSVGANTQCNGRVFETFSAIALVLVISVTCIHSLQFGSYLFACLHMYVRTCVGAVLVSCASPLY